MHLTGGEALLRQDREVQIALAQMAEANEVCTFLDGQRADCGKIIQR